ncbi:PD-(D/E)XK nuclease family protein [Sulfurovum sp.]|uniref:PD-(D/E)XK nuclease family protein n=1 Tax=Sulfurovum sp. TaxID=1969726 RepID=UPI0028683AD8|nr:PD-(D/E)XK nuclease family protein [Sulfurovum sp.]
MSNQHKELNGFLPTLMRMDEFEQRAILLQNTMQIDPLQRILLLREAAKFEAFEDLKLDISLVRFFTKSDALFKFFEELAAEQIDFVTLSEADAYVEFGTHLEILERLLKNYKKLLDERGYTDKAFIPSSYRLNIGFLKTYEHIEVHLEGYLSHFELELLENISKESALTIHYNTSKFNKKMQERFETIGITLKNDQHISFSMTDKKVFSMKKNESTVNAKVYAVEEREEQIAVAFAKIEEMVISGLQAEEIVLILPDESFKEHFTLFDRHNNLNFAMGYDYSNGRIYKSLEALYRYWQSFDEESKKLLERYGFNFEEVEKLTAGKKIKVDRFFTCIDGLGLHDSPLLNGEKKEKFNERVYEKYLHFIKVLEMEELGLKEWLFLWLKSLSKVTMDDVRGGKITVMGVLETRGVYFEGVVIVDFNEGVVPATSSKDQFLNSSVRAFANLPTKNDREALQKQYYKRLLEQASQAVILYSSSDNKLPSKFLYELGLSKAEQTQAQFDLLYAQPSQLKSEKDPHVENFNAQDITWSASRLKTYLECKRKYYYRYIQRIQAKEEDELNEGSFLHTVLERIHEKNDHYTSSNALELAIHKQLDALLPFDDAKTAYRKLLWKEKLKGYIETQVAHFGVEWKVIHREKEFTSQIGGLNFKGRIDRIDQNATDTLVLDYKSGNVEKEPKKLNPEKIIDFQMSIYLQLLAGKYQNISLAFLKILDGGAMQEVTLLEERNALLEEHIDTLKQTKSFVAEKCEDLQKCKWCEFTLICGRGEYL